jgi:hypothetical protein
MGLFLSLSGAIACGPEPVVAALRAFAESNRGTFGEADSETAEEDELIVCAAAGGVTVMYPRYFDNWDGASEFLSERLDRPVFSLHIHDGDLWMYILYDKGAVIDRFNPLPEYWEKLEKEERRSWQGNASVVASRVPGIAPEQVSRYLIQWTDRMLNSPEQEKAYATDECHYGEDWQLLDFMAKLGLDYPIQSEEIRGTKYEFRCKRRS